MAFLRVFVLSLRDLAESPTEQNFRNKFHTRVLQPRFGRRSCFAIDK